MAGRNKLTLGEKLAHMWLHESERVYGDRFVSPEDLKKYNDLGPGPGPQDLLAVPGRQVLREGERDPFSILPLCEDIEEHTYDQVRSLVLRFPSRRRRDCLQE